MTPEKALLVQVVFPGAHGEYAAESLEELALLAASSGAEVVGAVTQELPRPFAPTLLGPGKLAFLAETARGLAADVVIFDNELSPVQNRNIERALEVKVLDRTGLILDLFALRAHTREGKLQVELAQLEYMRPRLVGRGVELSRLGGGIGTRGPGETQLEMDRRRIQDRIVQIKRRLVRVRKTRALHRAGRRAQGLPVVALVGYTNAGKSTLLNALAGAEAYTADRLFATLDPMHRRVVLPSGSAVLVVDTVGFIRRLPHQLVAAFRATLEEVIGADLLLHVIDASHPMAAEQERAVIEVLAEIGAAERPLLRVLNKTDLVAPGTDLCAGNGPLGLAHAGAVCVSALRRSGLADLLRAVDRALVSDRFKGTYRIPCADGRTLADLYRAGRILRRREQEDAVVLDVEMDPRFAKRFSAFRVMA